MDIDIDVPPNFSPSETFVDCVLASMVTKNELKKHPVGIYLQDIKQDPLTSLAAIPYKEAEELGYFKLDFLSLHLLDFFDSKSEMRLLLNTEPDWMLLQSAVVVKKLFQIHNHFDIVEQIKPTSIIEVADTIALIRPAKRFLLSEYIKHKDNTRPLIYAKPVDGKYYFKKSHAIAYAHNIVLQLHLIKANIV